MGRAAKKPETGNSARLAASRRQPRPDRAEKAKAPSSARPRGGRGSARGAGRAKGEAGPSSFLARIFKFVVLLAFMAVLGFSIVLIADVGLTLVGGMRFGQITFAELLDKVQDRFLDRDLPAPKPKAAKKAPSTTAAKAPTSERAPEAAPRPDEYARQLEHRPDPEVEAARDRLNDLLKKL